MNPRVLFVELTGRCNMSCEFCLGHGKDAPVDLDPSLALGVIEQSMRLGVRHVLFTGGEPTLATGLDAAVRTLSAAGVAVSILTNGLERHEMLVELGRQGASTVISVDGPETVHDRIRGRKGAWRQAIRLLTSLRNSKANAGVQFTATWSNLDCLDWLQEFVRECDIPAVTIAAAAFPGPRKATICHDVRAMQRVHAAALAIMRESHYHRTARTNLVTSFQARSFHSDASRVMALSVTATGDVYALPYTRDDVWRIGHLHDGPMHRLIEKAPTDIHLEIYRAALARVCANPISSLFHELHMAGSHAPSRRAS